jgi:hypothetical protein
MLRTFVIFDAGGVVVEIGPLSVDDDDAFEGEGDWSLIWLWLNVTIVPLPLPKGDPGPLFIDWIGEKVLLAPVGIGDVLLWLLRLWFMLLLLLLLLLLFVLLLLLLQFNNEISGLRSGGDKGAIWIIAAGSRPLIKRNTNKNNYY